MTGEPETIEGYLDEVLALLPPAAAGRDRIQRDLKAHLRESAEAAGSEAEAVRRMGPAEETAAGYAEGLELAPASLADRTGAFLVDVGLGAVLAAGLFAADLDLGTDVGMGVTVVLAAVAAAMSLLYFPVLEERYGQTLGKRIFGLCVAREDGLRAELWRTVVRRLPLFFEVFWLDAVFAPFTEKRQRAFDIVAGTIVVPGEGWGGRGIGWTLALLAWTVPALIVLVIGAAGP